MPLKNSEQHPEPYEKQPTRWDFSKVRHPSLPMLGRIDIDDDNRPIDKGILVSAPKYVMKMITDSAFLENIIDVFIARLQNIAAEFELRATEAETRIPEIDQFVNQYFVDPVDEAIRLRTPEEGGNVGELRFRIFLGESPIELQRGRFLLQQHLFEY